MPGARNSQRDTAELREAKRKSREVAQHIERAGVMDEEEPDEGQSLLVGEAVKALGDGRIGGYLVRFSGADHPDLVGDYFTPETDFGTISTTNVLYHHGQDAAVKARSLGSGRLRKDDVGVWVEAQLKLADDYERAIYEMVKAGKLRWSSGTAPHLVERQPVGKAMWIKSWPLGLDASLTPTPAEPRNAAAAIKSSGETPMEPKEETISLTSSPAGAVSPSAAPAAIPDPRVEEMETSVKALAEQQREMSDRINQILGFIEQAPVLRSTGYVHDGIPVGGRKTAEIKSLANWWMAMSRRDVKSLAMYYDDPATKDAMASRVLSGGGALVPTEFLPRIMELMAESAVVRPRATVVPAMETIEIPALDQTSSTAPSAGSSNYFGGVTFEWGEENTTITDSTPKFNLIKLLRKETRGMIIAPNNLLNATPIDLENFLMRLLSNGAAYEEDRVYLRGSGVDEPLGVYTSDATATVTITTDATPALKELMEFTARMPQGCLPRSVWLVHPALYGTMNSLYNYVPFTQGAGTTTPPMTLLGRPVLISDKVPATVADGGIALMDFYCYLVMSLTGMELAMSTERYFEKNQSAWRVVLRTDGAPWVKKPVTISGSTTISPFLISA